jgi:hypothetical protein
LISWLDGDCPGREVPEQTVRRCTAPSGKPPWETDALWESVKAALAPLAAQTAKSIGEAPDAPPGEAPALGVANPIPFASASMGMPRDFCAGGPRRVRLDE